MPERPLTGLLVSVVLHFVSGLARNWHPCSTILGLDVQSKVGTAGQAAASVQQKVLGLQLNLPPQLRCWIVVEIEFPCVFTRHGLGLLERWRERLHYVEVEAAVSQHEIDDLQSFR